LSTDAGSVLTIIVRSNADIRQDWVAIFLHVKSLFSGIENISQTVAGYDTETAKKHVLRPLWYANRQKVCRNSPTSSMEFASESSLSMNKKLVGCTANRIESGSKV
jgi:hypothetical protein